MQEQESVQAEPVSRWSWSTATLAIVGSTVFVSGLFVLAAAGRAYPLQTYALVLGSAALLTLPLLLLTTIVSASEALLGRAWANGLRRLAPGQRGWRATGERALRYASILWLANGLAMWLATFAAQL